MNSGNTDGNHATGERPLLAFLGPETSYSHQATIQAFSPKEWDFQPAATIGGSSRIYQDVFEAVQRGEATLGVVPLENSTNGPVIFTLDTLADRDGAFPDICVCGEIYVDVHHFLVGRLPPPPPHPLPLAPHGLGGVALEEISSGACTPTLSDPHPRVPRARPVSSLGHVTRIYSHPQAFGQCAAFLATYLRPAEVFDVSSTSRAAEIVAGSRSGTWAAISSELAASVHGLDILARSIEDREDNTTRFFIISHGPRDMRRPRPTEAQAGMDGARSRSSTPPSPASSAGLATSKSMVSFTVPHHSPGALADALEGFRRSGLNLTSINSRPSLIKPFQYVFFVEFEGHKLRDPEGKVGRALEHVGGVAQKWRWLGSWDAQMG